jgi:hypothetical protein
MMKIERVTKTESDDPWYVRDALDLTWDSVYWTFPLNTRDFRWFNDIDTEVPF